MELKEKKKIFQSLGNLSEIANKKNWMSRYDVENDSLVIRKPNLSKDARKKYLTDEIAFYLNGKNNLEGIFIEYFTSNFVSHHKDMGPVINSLKEQGGENEIIELKKSETKKLIPKLEEVILDSFMGDNKLGKIN